LLRRLDPIRGGFVVVISAPSLSSISSSTH
jgi:hypothetical protein